MNYIVFDLEWNQCPYGKERENKRLPFEIIEIGALKLDENRNYEDSFHQVVKPVVYKKLHYRTKEILDIKGSDQEQWIPSTEAVKKFMKRCVPKAKFFTLCSSDLA